jgi:hypothetical protein
MNNGMPVEFFDIFILSTIRTKLLLNFCATIKAGCRHNFFVLIKNTGKYFLPSVMPHSQYNINE